MQQGESGSSKYIIGNGSDTFLWKDPWHPWGPIAAAKGQRIIYDSGLGSAARVSEIVVNNQWKWPSALTIDLIELKNSVDFFPNACKEDKITWLPSGDVFSIRSAYDAFRPQNQKPWWLKLVRFKVHIPRISFILWLTIKGRLSTGDRIRVFGGEGDFGCSLCSEKVETKDHLFFSCLYSHSIWTSVLRRLDKAHVENSFEAWAKWVLEGAKGNTFAAITIKLSFSISVYCIWRERNNRKFQRIRKGKDRVLEEIMDMVRMRLGSRRRIVRNQENLAIQNRWGLSDEVFGLELGV
ncbi:hypothetical protein U1Q18_052644 [Sarracenia purpurea var. burkii]